MLLSLTLSDNNNVSSVLTINAAANTSAAFTLDASAENDGTIVYTGGAGVDTVTGTTGADTISTGAGADVITAVTALTQLQVAQARIRSRIPLLPSRQVPLVTASPTSYLAQIRLRSLRPER